MGISYYQDRQTHFHGGPHQPQGCLQRAKLILGLYKCNYSLTVKELKLHSVASGANEFDTPVLYGLQHLNKP